MKSPQHPCAAYYTDNFSDPASGWPVGDDGNRTYAYPDGQYQILVKTPSAGWWATPGAKATDFTASVSAHRTSGALGVYGILFGINEDWSQLYEFIVEDTYFSIWKYNNGSWTALQDWTASSHINAGTAWNRLKLVRNGTSIVVYANNQLLATVSDSSFTGLRRIGLVAQSPDDSGLDARFDDFPPFTRLAAAPAPLALPIPPALALRWESPEGPLLPCHQDWPKCQSSAVDLAAHHLCPAPGLWSGEGTGRVRSMPAL